MSAITAKIKVPGLRFREFSGEWEVKRFDRFLKPNFREVPTPNTKYLAIGVRSHGKGTFQKPNSDPTKIAMESLFVVKHNDLVVNITFAWEGAIAIVKEQDHGGLVSHRFPTYELDPDQVGHEYFQQLIDQRRFRQKLELISPGGAGRNRVMSKPAFLKLEHRFPTLSEQKKIATFLGMVDEKLGALRRKRDLLVDYKRGAMQQIFSQQICFKYDDGSSFPEWEKNRLGKIAKFLKGRGLSKADITIDGDTPCIRYAELYTTYGEIISNVVSATNEPVNELVLSEYDDVVIPASGESAVEIAAAACVKQKGVALGGDLNIIRSNVSGDFLARYLTNYKKRDIARMAQGHSVVHLYSGQLKFLEISIPHPNEQKKIADFLSALDAKITAVADQITQTEAFKKGLLQQMFV